MLRTIAIWSILSAPSIGQVEVGKTLFATAINPASIQAVSIEDGSATPLNTTLPFAPNGAAHVNRSSGAGLVYFTEQAGSSLGVLDLDTGIATEIGDLSAVNWTDQIGQFLFDAAYWDGGGGLEEGLYIIEGGTDDLFRVSFKPNGKAIDDVVKVGDLLSNQPFGFGDIAFDSGGMLWVLGGPSSASGLYKFDIVAEKHSFINLNFGGQICFDAEDRLIASLGESLVELDKATGTTQVTITTNLGFGPSDLARTAIKAPWESIEAAGASSDIQGLGTLGKGTSLQVSSTSNPVGSLAYVVAGPAQINLPFGKCTLVPSLEFVEFIGIVDTGGNAAISAAWPPTAPAGLEYYFQIWTLDPLSGDLTCSNGLIGVGL